MADRSSRPPNLVDQIKELFPTPVDEPQENLRTDQLEQWRVERHFADRATRFAHAHGTLKEGDPGAEGAPKPGAGVAPKEPVKPTPDLGSLTKEEFDELRFLMRRESEERDEQVDDLITDEVREWASASEGWNYQPEEDEPEPEGDDVEEDES